MFDTTKICPLMTIASRAGGNGTARTPCIKKDCAFWIEFAKRSAKGGEGKCVLYALGSIEFSTRQAMMALEGQRGGPVVNGDGDGADDSVPF